MDDSIDELIEEAMRHETCALDVASEGSHTLMAVGDVMRWTRQNVERVEKEAMDYIARPMKEYGR